MRVIPWVFFVQKGCIMISCFPSLRSPMPGLNTRRRSRPHRLTLERLDERYLLTAGYVQTNLVSDIPHLARQTDANLVNPWGLSATPDGNIRVSDNGTGLSTVYTSDGAAVPPALTIPPPARS